MDGHRSSDFRWLLRAYTVSALGSGIGAGALPLVAVLILHASTFQVSLLAALSAAASAAVALPFTAAAEYRRQRAAMVCADLVRCMALGSVPPMAALGWLTFGRLCVVGVIQTAANLIFATASAAHLKGQIGADDRLGAISRFATIDWSAQAAGPPLGGILIGALGATATLVLDAVSFLGSALGIGRLRQAEPPPPLRDPEERRLRDLTAGWRYLFAHRELRTLLGNAMLFGGPIMMISALLAVFILRTLHLSTFDYGLALGVPCLGGLLGSRLAAPLGARFGQRRVLLCAGAIRTPWVLLLPLARPGDSGLVLVMIAEFGLLFSAGVFNPCFVTYRITATPDAFMVRVTSAWSITAKLVQPAFIALGGALSLLLGIRLVILLGGVLCCASVLLLSWRHELTHETEPRGEAREPTGEVRAAVAA